MRKSRSSADLFQIQVKQMGNPVVHEGFSYTERGDVTPDTGNNRRTRRMIKSMLRKDKALAIKSGSRGDNR